MDFSMNSVDPEHTIQGFSLLICCRLCKARGLWQPWGTEVAPAKTELPRGLRVGLKSI